MKDEEATKKKLSEILNKDTPQAPASPQEVEDRLTALTEMPPEVIPESSVPDAPDAGPSQLTDSKTPFGYAGQGLRKEPAENEELHDLSEFLNDIRGLEMALKLANETSEVHPGVDKSETIRATVRSTGELTKIVILRPWRTTVGLDGIEGAVVEAIAEATRIAWEKWAERLEKSTPAPTSKRTIEGDAFGLSRGRQVATDVPATIQVAGQLFDEFDARARAAEVAIGKHLERGTEFSSKNGKVSVTIIGGIVTGIRMDRVWLKRVSDAKLCQAVQVAISGAKQSCEPAELKALNNASNEVSDIIQTLLGSIK